MDPIALDAARRRPLDGTSRRVPAETGPDLGRRAAEAAVVGLFLLAALVVLHVAASLVVPMVAAVIVGSVLAHVGDRGQQIGVPPAVAAMTLVVLTGTGIVLLVDALAEPMAGLVDRLPEIATRLSVAVTPLFAPIAALRMRLVGAAAPNGVGGVEGLFSALDPAAVTGFVGGVTPALGEIVIFLATLVFWVAGRSNLRRHAVLAVAGRERRLAAIRIFNATEAALALHFGTTTVIYAGVGVATGLVAWGAGFTAPVLWGVMGFLLGYIPFLGAAIVALALVAAGLFVRDGILAALLPAAAYLVVHLVSENAVIPAVLGRRFEINPFLVFVAIVFWTWMWGAMGAVLAVPLLLVARTVLDELRADTAPRLPD